MFVLRGRSIPNPRNIFSRPSHVVDPEGSGRRGPILAPRNTGRVRSDGPPQRTWLLVVASDVKPHERWDVDSGPASTLERRRSLERRLGTRGLHRPAWDSGPPLVGKRESA